MIPSVEKAEKIFQELWENNPKYRQELEKRFEEQKNMFKIAAKKGKFAFVNETIFQNSEDTKIYLSRLKELGYDAIQDYSERGVFKSPIILLDPSSSVTKRGEKEITKILKMMVNTKLSLSGRK